jgi:biotin synthase-related radical SAM superfamily protein
VVHRCPHDDKLSEYQMQKSRKIPMETYQTVDLVRFIIDSEAGFFLIPDQRIDKIVSTIN